MKVIEVYKCPNCGFLYDICRFDHEREMGHVKHMCCPTCKVISPFVKIGNTDRIRQYDQKTLDFISSNLNKINGYKSGHDNPLIREYLYPRILSTRGEEKVDNVEIDGIKYYDRTCRKCGKPFIVSGRGCALRIHCNDCKTPVKEKKPSLRGSWKNGKVVSIPVPPQPEVKKPEPVKVPEVKTMNKKFYLITKEGKKEINLYEAMEVLQSDQSALYIQIGA
jgi:hypothetical protein